MNDAYGSEPRNARKACACFTSTGAGSSSAATVRARCCESQRNRTTGGRGSCSVGGHASTTPSRVGEKVQRGLARSTRPSAVAMSGASRRSPAPDSLSTTRTVRTNSGAYVVRKPMDTRYWSSHGLPGTSVQTQCNGFAA